MHRIDSPGSVAGAWVDRDAVGGIPGAQFVADWMNEAQEELVAPITAAGMALAKGTNTQLRDAIKRAAGSFVKTINNAGSPAALAPADAGLVLIDASAGAVLVTLPAANAIALPIQFRFVRIDSTGNAVTVSRAGADTIDNALTSFSLIGQGDSRLIQCDLVSKWYSFEDMDTSRKLPVSRLHSVLARPYLNLTAARNAGTPNTKLDIAADDIDVGGWDFPAVAFTIDAGTVGANGLDAGALANSIWYFFYAVANITDPTAPLIRGLLSTSATAPTMPAGYTLKRLLGAVQTDGAAHFVSFYQSDNLVSIVSTSVLSGGTQTVYTSVGLSGVVPPTAKRARGWFQTSNNGQQVNIASDANGTGGMQGGAQGTTTGLGGFFETLLKTAQTIYYLVGANSVSISINGWSY